MNKQLTIWNKRITVTLIGGLSFLAGCGTDPSAVSGQDSEFTNADLKGDWKIMIDETTELCAPQDGILDIDAILSGVTATDPSKAVASLGTKITLTFGEDTAYSVKSTIFNTLECTENRFTIIESGKAPLGEELESGTKEMDLEATSLTIEAHTAGTAAVLNNMMGATVELGGCASTITFVEGKAVEFISDTCIATRFLSPKFQSIGFKNDKIFPAKAAQSNADNTGHTAETRRTEIESSAPFTKIVK